MLRMPPELLDSPLQNAVQYVTQPGNVVRLSQHSYGCRIVQRLLEHCTAEDVKQTISADILKAVTLLAPDQFGNYVVQHILKQGSDAERYAS